MTYLDETMTADLQKEATRMRRAAAAIENNIARSELIRAMGIENHREVWAVLPGTADDHQPGGGFYRRGDDLDGISYDRWESRSKAIANLTMAELKTIKRIGVARFTWFD